MTDLRTHREQEFHRELALRFADGNDETVRALGDFWETPGGRVRFNRRLRMFAEFLKPSDRCLEIGCGFGVWSNALSTLVGHLTSIDLSPELIEIARKRNPPAIDFEVADAQATRFAADAFDKVICVSALHHLDLGRVIPEIARVLKPGGLFIGTEPNMLNPQVALERSTQVTRRYFGNSPDETAFIRWRLRRQLARHFAEVQVTNFDFYHPALGAADGGGFVERALTWLERLPGIREISGSLFIVCRK